MASQRRLALGVCLGLQVIWNVLKNLDIGRDSFRLNRTTRWREVTCRGQAQGAVARPERNNRLYRAFAESARPDDGRPLVILQGAGDDLGCGSGTTVDQHDHR